MDSEDSIPIAKISRLSAKKTENAIRAEMPPAGGGPRVSVTREVKVASRARGRVWGRSEDRRRLGSAGEESVVPGGEEEDERAGPGAAGPQRGGPAAEAAAGDGGHRLPHEQQRERGATQRRGGVGAVHAVGPLLPRVRLQPRLRSRDGKQGDERWRRRHPRQKKGKTENAARKGRRRQGECTEGWLCTAPMARPKATRSTSRTAASTLVEPAIGCGLMAGDGSRISDVRSASCRRCFRSLATWLIGSVGSGARGEGQMG